MTSDHLPRNSREFWTSPKLKRWLQIVGKLRQYKRMKLVDGWTLTDGPGNFISLAKLHRCPNEKYEKKLPVKIKLHFPLVAILTSGFTEKPKPTWDESRLCISDRYVLNTPTRTSVPHSGIPGKGPFVLISRPTCPVLPARTICQPGVCSYQGVVLNPNLTETEQQDLKAYTELVNNTLIPAELFITWLHDDTLKAVRRLAVHFLNFDVLPVTWYVKHLWYIRVITDQHSCNYRLVPIAFCTRMERIRRALDPWGIRFIQGRTEVRWRPQVRTWSPSDASVLYWRKYFWHCWSFSAPWALYPLVTPLDLSLPLRFSQVACRVSPDQLSNVPNSVSWFEKSGRKGKICNTGIVTPKWTCDCNSEEVTMNEQN